MAQQTINIGTTANDGTGDTLRDGGDKINDNFTELYGALVGLLEFKGSTDCSTNPNYPAASKGDFYRVSVAGKIGGASGIAVEVGDAYYALADNAGGDQATVGSSWAILQGNTFAAAAATETIIIACSDETTAITTGTAKVTFRMPYAFTLTAVRASVTTAPTGSTIIIDINEAGSTILSTKLSIDASEKTSTTAATAAVISDSSLADDAEITIDFDQVGSTIAGAGVKVYLIGHQ